jgi:hypothetical protein
VEIRVSLLLREPCVDPVEEVDRERLLRDVFVPRIRVDRAPDDERAASLRRRVGRRGGIRTAPAVAGRAHDDDDEGRDRESGTDRHPVDSHDAGRPRSWSRIMCRGTKSP